MSRKIGIQLKKIVSLVLMALFTSAASTADLPTSPETNRQVTRRRREVDLVHVSQEQGADSNLPPVSGFSFRNPIAGLPAFLRRRRLPRPRPNPMLRAGLKGPMSAVRRAIGLPK